MSIKIGQKKLIIEIECEHIKPLSALAEYQSGLVSLLHIADVAKDKHGEVEIENGLFYTTNLLKEMLLTLDQQSVLNEALNAKQIEQFNNWV